MAMQFYLNANLKPFHTFSMDQTCDALVEITSLEELKEVYQSEEWMNKPKLLLGKGSNVLFCEHFEGVVVVNRLLGKSFQEDNEHYRIHVEGGEDWPSLVEWTVMKGIGGLENLAMIPGCAGSAPIQNIGAYGVEFKDVCEYVDFLCFEDMNIRRLSVKECNFGYRDSIFKHELYEKGAVVGIGLKLTKAWKACSHYGPLQSLSQSALNPRGIFEAVCEVRRSKLPDPSLQGNAGSFFKNPEISHDHFDRLTAVYPNIVGYPVGDKIKVAAGWLIDQSGFKGVTIGGAQVHPKQALVLINQNHAKPCDVVELAAFIRETVLERYEIALEHEVRFIGAAKETNLSKILEGNK